MKDLKYFNTISDFNNVKYDFSTPTISYVEEDKNVRYNSYDNVNTYYGFAYKNDFIIACKHNALSIKLLQKPGKKLMDYKSFFNGNQNLFKVNETIN